MTELAKEFQKMKEAGVALHAITAEPGGNEALKTRLAKKDTDVPFPIHSDTDRKLCAKPGDGHYMIEEMNAGKNFGGDYVGIVYDMVQPAMEIVDKTGAVVRKWSWHSLQPPPDPVHWSTKIQVGDDSIILVLARPLSADILPAIKEGRDPRLASSITSRPKPAAPPAEASPAKAATLYYFPAGGRAELIRLIAAAGRFELVEGGVPGDDMNKSEFGSPSGIPLLRHGDLKMSQSTAIENYMSLWSFPDLTPQDRAKDAQFCCIKEDVAAGAYKVIFSPTMKEDPAKAAEDLANNCRKWYTVIERLLPANGFVNGLVYPTAADCAVLNMCDTVMAFGIANKVAGVDWALYPKMRALANRTAEFPSIKGYLAKSTTFTANPMGL